MWGLRLLIPLWESQVKARLTPHFEYLRDDKSDATDANTTYTNTTDANTTTKSFDDAFTRMMNQQSTNETLDPLGMSYVGQLEQQPRAEEPPHLNYWFYLIIMGL